MLDKIVKVAVDTLDACDHAGISWIEGRRITSPASTDEVSRIVEHEVFVTGDLTAETRWPEFASRAHEETGIRSILSLRLFTEEDTMGALNLYSAQPDAFAEGDIAVAAVFAAHAAVALSASRREHDLERKADSRDLIGQAKGILMARCGIDEDAAFDLLRRASQRLNIKLVDVAKQVTHPPEQPAPE